jgi:nicotinamidase-related amidase
MRDELALPPHVDLERVSEVWRVDYEARFRDAAAWAAEHDLGAAARDERRVCLLLVDVQNTFCTPGFELFVTGRSGTGALDDSKRICAFLYRNLGTITQTVVTLDTHQAFQIFHAIFLVNDRGEHPAPYSLVSVEDVERGTWRVNPAAAAMLGLDQDRARRHLLHYTRRLKEGAKYDLTVWPYHAMLGGIGHALVSAVEEAVFFHGIARQSQPSFQVKGNAPLTEHYSVLGPEVSTGAEGEPLAGRNAGMIDMLAGFDRIVIAGQAKSHCVAWTLSDLLEDPRVRKAGIAGRVYLLEDCTSPVVVPGVVDYTEQADAAFRRFTAAGMRVVRSTDSLDRWPAPAGRTAR